MQVLGRFVTMNGVVRLGLTLAAAVLALTSAPPAVTQTHKEIAVLLPAAGDPYFKLKACGYLEAGRQAGYDVKIYDAGGYGNLDRQVSQIQDVIQRKVSGIVLVPASSDGTVPAVEQAIAAGIPVVNDGIATHSDKVTGFVGEPSYVMTELLAAFVADKLGGKGEVVMLSGPSGLDLTKLRVNGFKDYLAKFPHESGCGEVHLDLLRRGAQYHAGFPAVASERNSGLYI
jgi:ABC-type sugar transport system substrate-binding protein